MIFNVFRSPAVLSLIVTLAAAPALADVRQKLFEQAATDPQLERQISRVISNIENGQTHQAIQQIIQTMFQIAPTGQLTEADIDRFEQQSIAKHRGRFLGQYLAFDLDGDGVIGKSEMDVLIGGEAAQIATLRGSADTNGDGEISFDELRQASAEQANQRLQGRNDHKYLMAFDLNEDGTVNVDEVLKAIRILAGDEIDEASTVEPGDLRVTTGTLTKPEETVSDAPVENKTSASGLPVELHMIGIYEPRKLRSGDGLASRAPVTIKVDRPGVAVALVLGSYRPTRWVIETTEGTEIETIIAHDRNRVRGEVVLNGEKTKVTHRNLPLAYKARGNRLQPFHEAAIQAVGVRNAASFDGSYTAPVEGFVIDDAPGVPTRAEVQAALTAQALDVADLSPKLRAAFEGKIEAPGSKWALREEGFVGPGKDGKPVLHKLPVEAPDVSWFMGAAHDPEGQLIWGVTLGGEGYLYEYDIRANTWSVRSMDNVDVGGLIFDPASGNLITTPGPHGNPGFRVLSRSGVLLSILKLKVSDYPGLLDSFDPGNGPSPLLKPVMIDGSQLLVRATPRHGMLDSSFAGLTYLVDLQDGDVRLVRKK